MATFDSQIRKVAEYAAELRAKGRTARAFASPCSVGELKDDLPIHVGPGANRGIILRSDTFVELGSPDAGSCAFVLWTDDPTVVSDGQITLIGPDIPEAPGARLPFGQILLVGGSGLGPEDHPSLEQAQYVADQVEGYMVKSFSRTMWSRVSKDAVAKGFCFATLARSLMVIFKSSVPAVQAMEAVFVTSAKEDVLRLEDIAGQVREVGREIVKAHWKARGFDLECEFDCRSCHDREVCDDIREVIRSRRNNAESASADRAAEPGGAAVGKGPRLRAAGS
jgi:CO dehydrogenase/acetyl-CoA synthase beta subunit